MTTRVRHPARRSLRPTAIALPTLIGALISVPAAQASTALVGTFGLTAGSCAGTPASGSYFRMVLPSGGASGPYVSNSDSACPDQSYTLLKPGTDGGLRTGSYQSEPKPAFDSSGNGKAAAITAPTRFYGVDFATSSNPVDPQTQAAVTAPRITVSGNGTLGGDLRAIAASWNNQEFNQGGPKPDGSTPGNTTRPTGHYDAKTGAFTLQWASQISGGPFDRFTGVWHLQGRFVPAHTSGSGSSSGSDSGSGSGAGSGSSAGGQPTQRPAAISATPGGGGNAAGTPAPGATSGATTSPSQPATSGPDQTQAPGDSQQAAGAPDSPSRELAGPESSGRSPTWWLVAVLALLATLGSGAATLVVRGRMQRVSR